MRPNDRPAGLLAALSLSAALLGCEARALVPGPDEACRDQVRELEQELAAAKARNAELTKTLEAAQRAAGPKAPLDAEAAAEVPRATRLALAWGSAIERDRSDPARAMLTLYLEPLDARGRFVQVSGQLSISAVSVPLPGQGEPIKLGERTLSPRELRDQWRSGLTGTHYTVEVPLDLSRAAGIGAAAVSVELREGSDARPLAAAAVLDLMSRRPRATD